MKLDDLIAKAKELREKYGNLEVVGDTDGTDYPTNVDFRPCFDDEPGIGWITAVWEWAEEGENERVAVISCNF